MIAEARSHWPRFTAPASAVGCSSAYAFPLRLRDSVVGAINRFCVSASHLSEDDVALGQALADTWWTPPSRTPPGQWVIMADPAGKKSWVINALDRREAPSSRPASRDVARHVVCVCFGGVNPAVCGSVPSMPTPDTVH